MEFKFEFTKNLLAEFEFKFFIFKFASSSSIIFTEFFAEFDYHLSGLDKVQAIFVTFLS